MAIKNTLTPENAATRLAAAIETYVDGATDVTVTDVVIPHSSGMSNETVLFTAEWREGSTSRSERLVARVAPAGPAVFPRYDYGLEGRVMQALAAGTDIPVPNILFVTEDTETLGAPCMVMLRIDGKVAGDDPPYTKAGWVLDLNPDERSRMFDGALKVLGEVHNVDVDAVGLGELRNHPEAGLDGQIQFYRDFFEWAREGESNPTVEAGFTWLEENRPSDVGESVLTWGDARPGNIIYGDDLSVKAVLDWELVAYRPAGMDLGWFAFMTRHHSDGLGAPLPDGIPTPEETAERYEQLTGRVVGDVRYWEVFAALTNAVMLHRAGQLMIQYGLMPPDTKMKVNNPATQIVAKLTGLPAPEGDSEMFLGNR